MKSVEIGRVDLSLVESAGFHTPMLEDLHIRTIVHQLLYGLLHGFSKLGVALLDSDALLGTPSTSPKASSCPSVWEMA